MSEKYLVRKVDEVGRVVIPAGLRRNYHIKTGDSIEVFLEDNMVILQKFNRGCIFCGEMKGTKKIGDSMLCPDCAHDLLENIEDKE